MGGDSSHLPLPAGPGCPLPRGGGGGGGLSSLPFPLQGKFLNPKPVADSARTQANEPSPGSRPPQIRAGEWLGGGHRAVLGSPCLLGGSEEEESGAHRSPCGQASCCLVTYILTTAQPGLRGFFLNILFCSLFPAFSLPRPPLPVLGHSPSPRLPPCTPACFLSLCYFGH